MSEDHPEYNIGIYESGEIKQYCILSANGEARLTAWHSSAVEAIKSFENRKLG